MLRKLQRTMTMMMIAMMTAMVMTLQSNPCPQALQGWHVKVKRFFFSSTTFFKKKFLLFTSSTNLTARSFDHSCRKPTKMEIKK
jgi:hypothetical protein